MYEKHRMRVGSIVGVVVRGRWRGGTDALRHFKRRPIATRELSDKPRERGEVEYIHGNVRRFAGEQWLRIGLPPGQLDVLCGDPDINIWGSAAGDNRPGNRGYPRRYRAALAPHSIPCVSREWNLICSQ